MRKSSASRVRDFFSDTIFRITIIRIYEWGDLLTSKNGQVKQTSNIFYSWFFFVLKAWICYNRDRYNRVRLYFQTYCRRRKKWFWTWWLWTETRKTILNTVTQSKIIWATVLLISSEIKMSNWTPYKNLGRNSQNFLHKFLIFFVTLGLKILRLKWL